MTEPKAYMIEFLSNEWTRNCLCTVFIIATYLFIGKFMSPKNKLRMGMLISILLFHFTEHL